MAAKNRLAKFQLNDVVPFNLYVQRRNLEWVRSEAGHGHMSAFIDSVLANARIRTERRKDKSTMKRQRIEIARLQGIIVQLGGTIEEPPVTVDEIQEDLQ